MSNGAKSRRQSALLLASLGSNITSMAAASSAGLEAQAYAVACLLPEGWQVLHALRYGSPTIEQAIAKIDDRIEELFVVPMHPQYSDTTSGTILREVYRVLGESRTPCDLVTRTQWHNDGGYVNAQARLVATYTSSMELHPQDTQLLFLAQRLGLSGEPAGESYEDRLNHTVALVLERLGWSSERASISFDPADNEVQPDQSDLATRLRALAEAGEKKVVLFPLTPTYDAPATQEQLFGLCPDGFSESGGQVLMGPALGTYGPFMTAVKNLAVRGPRSVALGSAGTAQLLMPRSVTEHVDMTPGSLVMIGASIAGKVRSKRIVAPCSARSASRCNVPTGMKRHSGTTITW